MGGTHLAMDVHLRNSLTHECLPRTDRQRGIIAEPARTYKTRKCPEVVPVPGDVWLAWRLELGDDP